MEAFLHRQLSGPAFQRAFLEKFKAEQRSLDEWTYRLLDEAFGHVDAFVDDASLFEQLSVEQPGWPLNAEQLRHKLREIVNHLNR